MWPSAVAIFLERIEEKGRKKRMTPCFLCPCHLSHCSGTDSLLGDTQNPISPRQTGRVRRKRIRKEEEKGTKVQRYNFTNKDFLSFSFFSNHPARQDTGGNLLRNEYGDLALGLETPGRPVIAKGLFFFFFLLVKTSKHQNKRLDDHWLSKKPGNTHERGGKGGRG